MPRRVLTDRLLKALKPGEDGRPYDVLDAVVPGLAVRVLPSGRRTFTFVGRFPGSRNPTRRALGEYGALGLDGARTLARHWHELLRAGKDPAEEATANRRAEAHRRENSFARVAEDFINLKLIGPDPENPRERKAHEVERDLRREFISRWGRRPISDITRRDVLDVLRETIARGAEYQAHNLLGHVRRLFGWAITQDAYGIQSSPCDRMKPKDVIGRKALRTRVLSDEEIFAQWRASGRLGYPYGPLFRLLILTGQRKSEVGEASWREFDPRLVKVLREPRECALDPSSVPTDWKVWIIPAERMKADAAHVVPLTDAAIEILAELPHYKRGDFLFSTTFGEKPVAGFSKAKERLDRHMLRTLRALEWRNDTQSVRRKLDPFVLHDLRRTMRTRLSALPIPDLVRELVIAHTKPGLHKVYDQHAYEKEKRDALELWTEKLRSLINPRENAPVSLAEARAQKARPK